MRCDDIRATLEPHARRPIRAFLADKRVVGTAAEDAFWEAVYMNVQGVDHTEAVRVANAMEASGQKVERVLEGWRP